MDVRKLSRPQAGVTLIEVLVALVVLSIGMLGVGAMFLSTLKDTRSSLYRSKAVAFAWDMAERIRANAAAGVDYATTASGTGSNAKHCATTSAVSTPDACSPAELAAYDIYQWKTRLQDKETGIPSGNGTIERDTSVTPARYTIEVTWTEPQVADPLAIKVVTQL